MVNSEFSHLKRRLQLIEQAFSIDIYNLGDEFFEKIILNLNEVLRADYTFIGELTEDKTAVETISIVHKTKVIDNFTYILKDTPCENVIGQHPCSYPKDIAALFPEDQLLIDMGIEAYVGVPLYDSKKKPTGILVCLFRDELKDIQAIESILMIFASRAGAELEHKKLYASLQKHKNQLEAIVTERTEALHAKNEELETSNLELVKTLNDLQLRQTQLVQSEKMASLGTLTSGVAHEINNPLNYLMGSYYGLKEYFETHESKEKEHTDLFLNSISVGIDRIAEIVRGLSMFSRKNKSMTENCDIHAILDNCLAILQTQTEFRIEVEKKYSDQPIVARGNSGNLQNAFLNVLTNSIEAIPKKGKIVVKTTANYNQAVVEIKDNGVGIEADILSKITDPFFTTKKLGDGIGLGLSITLGIIKEHNGSLSYISEVNNGTTIQIILPLKND